MLRNKLINLSLLKGGNWDQVFEALRKDANLAGYSTEASIEALTLLDDDYPAAFQEMAKPPFVLFTKGDLDLLKRPIICLTGGKQATTYSLSEGAKLLKQLPPNVAIMNGLEYGIESELAQAAKNRIHLLASGFEDDTFYQENVAYKGLSQRSLLISEKPPHIPFDLATYYRSYHLMYELASAIIVIDMPRSDIRLKYLRYLCELGKPVFVLPNRLTPQTNGGLALVSHGAKLLTEVKEVTDAMHPDK